MRTILLSLCLISAFANAEMIKIDTDKEVVIDVKNLLMWQDNIDVEKVKLDWKGAIDYCQNLIFSGYSDWRLPGIDELFSIKGETRENIAIDNRFKKVMSDNYWSSSDVYGSSYAWNFSFRNGYDDASLKNFNFYVRCVRDNK